MSRPSADAGDRDVADAVAHQGQPALHEVGADGRGGQAGEQRGDQRPVHEVVRQKLDHDAAPVQQARRARPAAVRVHVVVVGSRVVRRPARATAPSYDDPAVAHDHRAVDQRLAAGRARGRPARPWRRRSTKRAQRVGEGLLAGGVDARRWARRGPAGRARRPARGRSAPAAAGRRTGSETGSRGPVGQADGLERRGRPPSGRPRAAGAARRAGRAGRRRRPRGRWPARRWRRRAAAARSRSAATRGTARSGVPKSRTVAAGQRDQAEQRRGPGWTCPSRWRRARPPPRRRSTVRSMPRSTGRPPRSTGRRQLRPSMTHVRRHEQPSACSKGGEVGAHHGEVVAGRPAEPRSGRAPRSWRRARRRGSRRPSG